MTHEYARLRDECQRAGVLREFEAIVAKGTPPRAAAMYALQQAPGTNNTDQRFCQGQHKKMERLPKLVRDGMQDVAKQAGINTSGKYYVGALGKYSDPAAWVTCSQDVKDVAKARNIDLDGTLRHKADGIEIAPKKTAMAPDIIRQFERKYLAADPALREKCRKNSKARQELRERIVATHGRKPKATRRRRLFSS